jgi:hypothetical protein
VAAAVVQQAWRALAAHRAQLRALARLRAASRHHGHFQRRFKCGGNAAAAALLASLLLCRRYQCDAAEQACQEGASRKQANCALGHRGKSGSDETLQAAVPGQAGCGARPHR